jgi:Fic family protein
MVLTWEPITDLPQDWPSLTDGELGPLLQFWNDQRADLEQSGALAEFNKRLGREWSIETGQIEGVYDLDRGITQTLIERGIDADLIGNHPGQKPPEIIAAIIQDHADVLEGLFQFVKGSRPLSKSYIHELHAALLRHQETTAVRDQFGNLFEAKLLKGKYKERPNNPKKSDGSMHQYCPPEHVESEMERLLALHAEHEKKGVPVEVEAAWLHHRFTQIHPYQDGNGRVARALASLLFIQAGWFPVVVTRDDRSEYIDALEAADERDIRSLIIFFTDIQRRTLFQVIHAVADAKQARTVDEVIASVKQVLAGSENLQGVLLTVRKTADHLKEIAASRLEEIAKRLTKEVGEANPNIMFLTHSGSLAFDLDPQKLGHMPNRINYDWNQWLVTSAEHGPIMTIQAHAIGSRFRGIIAIVMLFKQDSAITLVSKRQFQVNYAESCESAERRFRLWLEESLVNALTLWRKSL